MKGSICLILTRNQQGQSEIVNTTQILDEVAPGKWLVTFMNAPPFQRVVNVEEVQQWMVFPNQEAANNWVEGNKAAPTQDQLPLDPAPTDPPIIDPDDDQGDAGDGTGRTNVEKRADDEAAASRPKGKH